MNPNLNIDTAEVLNLIHEYHEWKDVLDEAEAELEARKDALKAILTACGVDELPVDRFIVRYTSVTSNRLDTGLLKKELPDIAAKYTKASTSRRFTVSK